MARTDDRAGLAPGASPAGAGVEDAADGPRGDAQLLRRTRPYTAEQPARSWGLLIQTLLVLTAGMVGIVLVQPWWLKVPLAVVVGLVNIRLFIFYHDYLHGALLRRSRAASALMTLVGMHLLAVRSVWQETHDYHHRNNARMVGSSIGSYPVVNLRMWRRMNAGQRRIYRVMRHPVTIALGYFTVFLVGMSFSPFRRDPGRHWLGPVAVVVHVGLTVGASLLWNPLTGICLFVIPMIVAMGAGSYLFYAQHNFPDVRLFERRHWTFTDAALRSSSMFEMPRLMHWFTGNIGYHHIHHLNHRIPFYRLPEVMAEIPELQQAGRTSWRPSAIKACLDLAVWDPEQGRMITWTELAAKEAA